MRLFKAGFANLPLLACAKRGRDLLSMRCTRNFAHRRLMSREISATTLPGAMPAQAYEGHLPCFGRFCRILLGAPTSSTAATASRHNKSAFGSSARNMPDRDGGD